MAAEVFANQPSTTVSSGGTTAPVSGTQETWTVASSSSFPAASSTASPPTQFHVCDTASGDISEIIAVTNVSGTTWTVTRGAESTTPVAHTAGFTVQQVVTAGFLTTVAGALLSPNNLSDVASRQTSLNNLAGTQAAGKYLRSDGTNTSLTVIQAADVPQLPDYAPTGLTGAVAASRYAGATTSGAPAAGTFAVGDFVVDQAGTMWICITAGTPGTWIALVNTSGGTFTGPVIIKSSSANPLIVSTDGTTTSSGAFTANPAGGYIGVYGGGHLYTFAFQASGPPAVNPGLVGYYSGMGVQGISTSAPIFGVLNLNQSGNGTAAVAFTVYGNNKVQTYYNTLDDGSGNFAAAGGMSTATRTITASATVAATDSTVRLNGTSLTATLPDATTVTGRIYTVKVVAASTTGTVATTSSQLIDGATTYTLSAQYKSVTVQSNGTGWDIIATV